MDDNTFSAWTAEAKHPGANVSLQSAQKYLGHSGRETILPIVIHLHKHLNSLYW